jgi:hypothetical protein
MKLDIRLYQGAVVAKEHYERKRNRPMVWLAKLAVEIVMRIVRVP